MVILPGVGEQVITHVTIIFTILGTDIQEVGATTLIFIMVELLMAITILTVMGMEIMDTAIIMDMEVIIIIIALGIVLCMYIQ